MTVDTSISEKNATVFTSVENLASQKMIKKKIVVITILKSIIFKNNFSKILLT